MSGYCDDPTHFNFQADLAKCREELSRKQLIIDRLHDLDDDRQNRIHQLEAERDALKWDKQRGEKLSHELGIAQVELSMKQNRITTLEARLRKYGRHESLCDISLATGTKCSCGLNNPIEGKE